MTNDEADWQIFALDTKTDKSPSQVAGVIEKLYGLKVKRLEVDIDGSFTVDKNTLLDKLEEAGVPENYSENGKCLFFLGGGQYHHLAYGLTKFSGRTGFGFVDRDAHTDDGRLRRLGKEWVDFGRFTDLLEEDCGASSITYMGICHKPKIRSSRRATVSDLKGKDIGKVTEEMMADIPEKHLYQSTDLDVLDSRENVRVDSRWQNDGRMSLNGLLDSIRVVRNSDKEVFAADIGGYESWEAHRGWPASDEWEHLVEVKSCLAVSAVAGEIMGLDTSRARGLMAKVDSKLRLDSYIYMHPKGGGNPAIKEMLERNSKGVPGSYRELLKVLSEKA